METTYGLGFQFMRQGCRSVGFRCSVGFQCVPCGERGFCQKFGPSRASVPSLVAGE